MINFEKLNDLIEKEKPQTPQNPIIHSDEDFIKKKIEKICSLIRIHGDDNYVKVNKVTKKSGFKGSSTELSQSHINAFLEVKKRPMNFFIWFTDQEITKWSNEEKLKFKERIKFFEKNKQNWKGWGHFSIGFENKSGVKCISYCRKNFPKIKFK